MLTTLAMIKGRLGIDASDVKDDELLSWFVCSRALDWITTDESKRMRYERVRGASATGQGDRYQARYLEAVRLRQRQLRTGRRLGGPT